MLFEFFDDVNWLAVIVATLAYFALGSVWYTDALFGKQWRAATGQEMGESGRPEPAALVVNFIGWFVVALALALIAHGIGAETFVDGLVLGLVASIGFVGTNRVVTSMYEGRNAALMRINAPYTILGYVIMGVILAMWK